MYVYQEGREEGRQAEAQGLISRQLRRKLGALREGIEEEVNLYLLGDARDTCRGLNRLF